MESRLSKEAFRSRLIKVRAEVSRQRREEARVCLLEQLLPELSECTHILSFASFGCEIDTSLINESFARSQRLYLPRITGTILKIFHVRNLEKELIANSFGLLQPNPAICEEADPRLMEAILVPALGFDKKNQRLGYGKGCYDRFLKEVPHARTLGIGFKEQLVESLPTHMTDIPLEKVSLF